jgi:hypothetical protein
MVKRNWGSNNIDPQEEERLPLPSYLHPDVEKRKIRAEWHSSPQTSTAAAFPYESLREALDRRALHDAGLAPQCVSIVVPYPFNGSRGLTLGLVVSGTTVTSITDARAEKCGWAVGD